MVYVCAEKDIECGDYAANWCSVCPKRGLLQVAVAPNAAAGPYPTPMRPATAAEHKWLSGAIKRSGVLVGAPPPAISAAVARQALGALTASREYVESATARMYDGTNGYGIRQKAARRLTLIDTAITSLRAALSAELEKTK